MSAPVILKDEAENLVSDTVGVAVNAVNVEEWDAEEDSDEGGCEQVVKAGKNGVADWELVDVPSVADKLQKQTDVQGVSIDDQTDFCENPNVHEEVPALFLDGQV